MLIGFQDERNRTGGRSLLAGDFGTLNACVRLLAPVFNPHP